MSALTPLGIAHTAISLVALAAAAVSFVRYRRIAVATLAGQLYIWTTVITCLTGFGIFQHGGFGKPHALGVLTLLTLALAAWAVRSPLSGSVARTVETIAYSTTVFFHLIPAVTETSTRLPIDAPLLPNADAPELQVAAGVLFALLVVGISLQLRWMRRHMPVQGSALAGQIGPELT